MENSIAVQEAFLTTDVFQCSYCASGMIMSAVALLKNNPAPSEEAIIKAMNGNICRCGTYPYIMKAIKLASAIINYSQWTNRDHFTPSI